MNNERLCDEGEHDMVEYKAVGVRDEDGDRAVDIFSQCKKCGGKKRVRTYRDVKKIPIGVTDHFNPFYPKRPEKIQREN